MTASVQQQGKQTTVTSEPVTQQAENNAWLVRFIMPRLWAMETLPQPDDSRVRLVAVLAKRVVVIRFSGLATAGLIQRLLNPPWTLPFLRRNEIMLKLADT